jgi:predicted MPP superfamily phosphohydrolase
MGYTAGTGGQPFLNRGTWGPRASCAHNAREMLVNALVAVMFALCAGVGYAVFGEPYRPIFKRHRLTVPPSWPALSLVHISDLHVRHGDQRLVRAQMAALKGLAPDLLCVTGDMCEKVADIQMVVDVLKAARPRLGTFVVLGNHEHNAPLPERLRKEQTRGWRRILNAVVNLMGPTLRSDGDEEGHAMAVALQAAGITVLHNSGRRIYVDGVDGQSLWIAGCDSAWAGHADMPGAMRGRRTDEACLALVHEPDLAFEAGAKGADVILAGHTHGGQVRLPFFGAPYTHRMDPRILIAAGFQRIGDGVLHITAGLGHTVPLRFGCPPEVVWLECEPTAVPATVTAVAA